MAGMRQLSCIRRPFCNDLPCLLALQACAIEHCHPGILQLKGSKSMRPQAHLLPDIQSTWAHLLAGPERYRFPDSWRWADQLCLVLLASLQDKVSMLSM